MNHNKAIYKKIKSLPELLPQVKEWKKANETVVFTNGCFDILHLGHVDYLSKAADKGSKLIVAVNTDASVRALDKGLARPIQDEKSRATIIASLGFVDAVILFGDDTPKLLIQSILPDVLVKGADYSIEQIVGHDIVLRNGGKVEQIDFVEGYSTSKIESKIKNS